jgi:Mce-associated membrane protein
MPPPRRRRPVQPATRVRLPRTARPRGTPAAETHDPETLPAGTGNGQPTAGIEAPPEDLSTDEQPAAELGTDEQPAEDLSTDEQPAAAVLTEDEPADLTEDEPPPAGDAAGDERRGSLALPVGLGVLAVILGGLAVWFGLAASSATSGVDTSNTALTNPAATSQVSQQVASAVNTIFSYNYADTARTSQAAAALLTGRAKGEYNTLFKLVRLDAPKEKLVLTTTVTNAGVEYLIGNQARVLIFANQQDTAGAAHKTTDAGAMFAVNAVYQGGRWKIAHIDTFRPGG